MLAKIVAHLRKQPDAAHVALAPPRPAVAHPVFLGDNLATKLVLLSLLFFQHLIAPLLERRKTALDPPRDAAIEPHGRARQLFEKTQVVADQHECGARAGEL